MDDHDISEDTAQTHFRQMTVRVTPELAREVRVRTAELDTSLREFVTSSIELVLRAEIDPRHRP